MLIHTCSPYPLLARQITVQVSNARLILLIETKIYLGQINVDYTNLIVDVHAVWCNHTFASMCSGNRYSANLVRPISINLPLLSAPAAPRSTPQRSHRPPAVRTDKDGSFSRMFGKRVVQLIELTLTPTRRSFIQFHDRLCLQLRVSHTTDWYRSISIAGIRSGTKLGGHSLPLIA